MVVTMKLKTPGRKQAGNYPQRSRACCVGIVSPADQTAGPADPEYSGSAFAQASQQSGFPVEEGEFAIEISQDEDQTIFHLTRIVQDQGQLQVFRFGTSEEMLGGCCGCMNGWGIKPEKTGFTGWMTATI